MMGQTRLDLDLDDESRVNYDGTDARQTIFGFLPSLKFVPWYEGIRDTSSQATQPFKNVTR